MLFFQWHPWEELRYHYSHCRGTWKLSGKSAVLLYPPQTTFALNNCFFNQSFRNACNSSAVKTFTEMIHFDKKADCFTLEIRPFTAWQLNTLFQRNELQYVISTENRETTSKTNWAPKTYFITFIFILLTKCFISINNGITENLGICSNRFASLFHISNMNYNLLLNWPFTLSLPLTK